MDRFLTIASCVLAGLAIVLSVRESPETSRRTVETTTRFEENRESMRQLERRVEEIESERRTWALQFPASVPEAALTQVSPTQPALKSVRGATSGDNATRPTVEETIRLVQTQVQLNQEQERAFAARLLAEEATHARLLEGKGSFYELLEARRKTDLDMSKVLAPSQIKAYAQFRLRNRQ